MVTITSIVEMWRVSCSFDFSNKPVNLFDMSLLSMIGPVGPH